MSEKEDREKAKTIGPLRGLVPFIVPYKGQLITAAGLLFVTAMISLSLPLAVRRVVEGFEQGATELMDQYFGSAILIAGLLGLGTALRYFYVTRLGERVVADIRKAVYARVISMSPAFFERIMTGEVLSRLTTDTTLILSVIGSSISVALRNVLIFVGGLIFMLFTSPKLTAMVLLLVPLVVFPILMLGRRLRKLSRENQDRVAESSGQASETLLAAQAVQAFSHEEVSRAIFGDLTEKAYVSARKRIGTRAFLTAIIIFTVFSGVVGVLWMGARDVREEIMTTGQLVQFVIYSIMVAGSVAALSEIWSELQRAAGATERLVELLNLKDDLAEPENPQSFEGRPTGAISFDNVTFRYPARPEHRALHEFSLEIKPGETVALVGPSGAGKTTVFQLLERFYDPEFGTVRLDGIDLRNMARTEMRKAYSLVPQDPAIFADTALENIRFGRPEATDAEVEAAAQAAAADEFIAKLPQGYKTYVGERGVMLSGGQKQRIAIARAILRDAPILLLDEATSALDAESERAVQDAVERLSKNRTTLIIAHRLATVKKADRIVVMEDGRIVAQGAHDKLVAEDGLYARLARLQFTAGVAA